MALQSMASIQMSLQSTASMLLSYLSPDIGVPGITLDMNIKLDTSVQIQELFKQQEEITTELYRNVAEGVSDVQRDELIRQHWKKFKQFISNVDKTLSDYERGLDEAVQYAIEENRRCTEDFVLYWGPVFIKCVAAQYIRLLLSNQLCPGFKDFGVSASSSDRFLRFMAKEIGRSVKDTALLCCRVIDDGDEGFEVSSCQYLKIYVDAAQAHEKLSLLMKAHECRTLLEEYSLLAAELPDQVALLVQAKILDELL